MKNNKKNIKKFLNSKLERIYQYDIAFYESSLNNESDNIEDNGIEHEEFMRNIGI